VGHCGLGEQCGGGEKTAELHVEMHFVP
jgi:hypothetical protein